MEDSVEVARPTMEARARTVQRWLDQLVEDDAAGDGGHYNDPGRPSLHGVEIDEELLSGLERAMAFIQQRSRDANVLLTTYQRLHQEYSSEAARLKAIHAKVGLRMQQMDSQSVDFIVQQARLAAQLDLSDTAPAAIMPAVVLMEEEIMQLEDKVREDRDALEELSESTSHGMRRLDALHSVKHQLETQSAQQEGRLEKRLGELRFYRTKAAEYEDAIAVELNTLEASGYQHELSHSSLIKTSAEISLINDKLVPVHKELNAYNDLPADVSLAKVALNQAKHDLAAAEEQLQNAIDLDAT